MSTAPRGHPARERTGVPGGAAELHRSRAEHATRCGPQPGVAGSKVVTPAANLRRWEVLRGPAKRARRGAAENRPCGMSVAWLLCRYESPALVSRGAARFSGKF